jgi:hypothetical protein
MGVRDRIAQAVGDCRADREESRAHRPLSPIDVMADVQRENVVEVTDFLPSQGSIS